MVSHAVTVLEALWGWCMEVVYGSGDDQAQIRQDVRKDTQRSQESKTGRSIPKSAASIEGASFSSLGLPCTPNSLGVSEKEYTLAFLPLPLLNQRRITEAGMVRG